MTSFLRTAFRIACIVLTRSMVWFVAGLLTWCTCISPARAQSAGHVDEPFGPAVHGRLLVSYRSGELPADLEAETAHAGASVIRRHAALGVAVIEMSATNADAMRLRLAADPLVEAVVEDRVVYAHSVTVAPAPPPAPAPSVAAPQGWAVRRVGGFGGTSAEHGPWSVTQGAGVRIAILDSGIDAAHPAFANKIALNVSEIDQAALPSACDDGSPADQQGHGTWTASLAAGAAGTTAWPIAGVAPQATLLNIKVLERMPGKPGDITSCATGQAAGLLSWVLQGIDDAVNAHADVISLSLGTLVDISTGDGAGLKVIFDHATHAATRAGVVIIAAAGNDGFDVSGSKYIELPAQARDVVALVASTNPACAENLAPNATCTAGPETVPYYSNRGSALNALAAPGGSYPAGPAGDLAAVSGWILGACSQGRPGTASGVPADAGHSFGCFNLGHSGYVQAMGTSASAPLAAGVVALIRAAHPAWAPAEVVAALRGSALQVTGMPVALVSATSALAR